LPAILPSIRNVNKNLKRNCCPDYKMRSCPISPCNVF